MGRRIEIIGGIATGKTTLTTALSTKERFKPLFERYDANPFLEAFYRNPGGVAFETELSFALLHAHDVKNVPADVVRCCDFSLLQDQAYADVTLTGSQHRVFTELLKELREPLTRPLAMIHLTCSRDEQLARIKRRARAFEASITSNYLDRLEATLRQRLAEYEGVPILEVDSGVVDFRVDPSSVEAKLEAALEKAPPT
jgi:deoxyguanosine kinase